MLVFIANMLYLTSFGRKKLVEASRWRSGSVELGLIQVKLEIKPILFLPENVTAASVQALNCIQHRTHSKKMYSLKQGKNSIKICCTMVWRALAVLQHPLVINAF